MSRYRLLPTPAQEAVLRDHCGHARYVWNLAVEQHAHWHPGRASAPGYREQCAQLTQARAEHPWLAAGSQTVQQQALRDFARAMTAFFDLGNPARRPSWRKRPARGIPDRGPRPAVGGATGVPQGRPGLGAQGRVGTVPLVLCRTAGGEVLPGDDGPRRALAYRLRRRSLGRCPAPGNGQAVGIDRGVAVSAALSTGELLHCPALTAPGADQAAATAASAGPRHAGLQPPRPGQARDRPAAGPRDGPAQGLGGEGQHRHRAAIRPDPGRGPADR